MMQTVVSGNGVGSSFGEPGGSALKETESSLEAARIIEEQRKRTDLGIEVTPRGIYFGEMPLNLTGREGGG